MNSSDDHELTRREALTEAADAYEQSVGLESGNVVVRLRMANVLEQLGRHSDAISEYLKVLDLWPDLFEARYRLAAALSFVGTIGDSQASADVTSARIVSQLIERYRSPIRELAPPDTLEVAFREWDRLWAEHGWIGTVKRWSTSWLAGERGPTLRYELRGFTTPWSRPRRVRRNMLLLARFCTEIQLEGYNKSAETPATWQKQIETRLRWPHAKNWQVSYNAACCLARLLHRVHGEESDRLAARAVALITVAQETSGGRLGAAWLMSDPDLTSLKAHRRAEAIFRIAPS